MTSVIVPIRIEQLNLNDEQIKIVKWFIVKGQKVVKDQPVCSVETTKSVEDILAPQEGVIYPIIESQGAMVKVGETIGLMAPSMKDIETYLSNQPKTISTENRQPEMDGEFKATAKARALAQQHGVDLAHVARMGVQGTIKEADVEKFLCIPSVLRPLVIDEGKVPEYEDYVARKLKEILNRTLPLTMDAVFDLADVNAYIEKVKKQGMTISLLHVVLAALPKALARHERFKMFQTDRRLFNYRQAEIAFIVRTIDGKLYMPVVHGLDQMNMEQIAEATQELALEANKGRLKPSQLMGACVCVSYISNKFISRFEAFTDSYQSAMLAVAGAGVKATLTLTYDHSLIDGWTAGAFLSDLIQEIETIAHAR